MLQFLKISKKFEKLSEEKSIYQLANILNNGRSVTLLQNPEEFYKTELNVISNDIVDAV